MPGQASSGPGQASSMPGQARVWAVFAGGGTGGHIYPGVAVADALVQLGHDPASLHFVGARRGVEATTRAVEGFPLTLLPGRGLSRRLSWDGLRANAEAVGGAAVSLVTAVRLFARWRPALVISLGGYASLACVGAALLWRVPVLVVNVDAVPGLVNRWAGRVASACAVTGPGVPLPRAVVTGVPVRPAMSGVDRSAEGKRRYRQRLGLGPDTKVVAVCGGSLGALRLNRATLGLAQLWGGRAGVAVRHVVGRRDYDEMHEAAPAVVPGGLVYQQVAYEDDMAALYGAADVAVQRAGANTVAELALAGVPSVLVPLPRSPGDHQGANARALAGAGAAVVVPDAELSAERLSRELETLLADPEHLDAMATAARSLARPRAAHDIALLAEQVARRLPPRRPPSPADRWPGPTVTTTQHMPGAGASPPGAGPGEENGGA